jgi:protein-tyrosine-phosphatase
MKVLFVCSGNICRSPMAAGYLRHRVESEGLAEIEVDSAGTLGIRRARASEGAIEAMAEIGIDITGHRSKGIKPRTLAHTDLTLAMSHDHLDYLALRHPEGEDERLLLRAFEGGSEPAPNPLDLADPIGHPIDFYREQLQLITRCVDHLVDHLLRLQ